MFVRPLAPLPSTGQTVLGRVHGRHLPSQALSRGCLIGWACAMQLPAAIGSSFLLHESLNPTYAKPFLDILVCVAQTSSHNLQPCVTTTCATTTCATHCRQLPTAAPRHRLSELSFTSSGAIKRRHVDSASPPDRSGCVADARRARLSVHVLIASRQAHCPPHPRRAQGLLRQRAYLPFMAQLHRRPRRLGHWSA